MHFGKKFRRGPLAVVLTALVIAAVILLNAGATALFRGNFLFIDLTGDALYTVNDETYALLDQNFRSVQDPQVEIFFCADPDRLEADTMMRYIYYTAQGLAKHYPDVIRVSTVDVLSNPSAVDAYRTLSYSSIYPDNIIVATESEFRIHSVQNFFIYDSDDTPWAYSGERIFARSIIAVTNAKAPICGITVNHGEPFALSAEGTVSEDQEYGTFLSVIESAGYKIQPLNLEDDEIPEDCRLIVIFDPQTDFSSEGYLESDRTSELKKLDRFLDDTNSLMVFADSDTPQLPLLEEFLADWGIAFERYEDGGTTQNYQIVSPRDSLDTDGTTVIGVYETGGTGASFTSEMMSAGKKPKVVFGDAIPIRYSASYEQIYVMADSEKGTAPYRCGSYSSNGHSRAVYDLFRTTGSDRGTYARTVGDSGEAGSTLVDPAGFKLATVTVENRVISEWLTLNVSDPTYVCAFSSTAFASDELLDRAYGNTDLLLQILRWAGREVIPVNLGIEPMDPQEINSEGTLSEKDYSARTTAVTTVILVLIPALTVTAVGIRVLVRRKNTAR